MEVGKYAKVMKLPSGDVYVHAIFFAVCSGLLYCHLKNLTASGQTDPTVVSRHRTCTGK